MIAGPDLDLLVAEKVMGYKRIRDMQTRFPDMKHLKKYSPDDIYLPGAETKLPRFSTDIAAAWRVIEHMKGLACGPEGIRDNASVEKYDIGFNDAIVEIIEEQTEHRLDPKRILFFVSPRDICLAALKTHGVSVDCNSGARNDL